MVAALLLLREVINLQENIVVLNDQLDILWEAVFEDPYDPLDPDEQTPPGSHSNIVAFKRSA